ncbi:MAG: hypothetical protein R3C56_12800 [Pirellulaceae bacterium]
MLKSIKPGVGQVPTVEIMTFAHDPEVGVGKYGLEIARLVRIQAAEGMQDLMSLKSLIDLELIDRPTAFAVAPGRASCQREDYGQHARGCLKRNGPLAPGTLHVLPQINALITFKLCTRKVVQLCSAKQEKEELTFVEVAAKTCHKLCSSRRRRTKRPSKEIMIACRGIEQFPAASDLMARPCCPARPSCSTIRNKA